MKPKLAAAFAASNINANFALARYNGGVAEDNVDGYGLARVLP